MQSPYIQLVNLSSKCDTDLGNIDAIAIGNGDISMRAYKPRDNLVRFAHLTTMSSAECEHRTKKHNNSFAIICAEPKNDACVAHGDSGNELSRDLLGEKSVVSLYE